MLQANPWQAILQPDLSTNEPNTMHDSDTYQAALNEGEVRGLRWAILLLGSRRFGEPNEATRKAIEHFLGLNELRGLMERFFEVSTWENLLQRRRGGWWRVMEDSDTYQAILEEGAVRASHRFLLALGEKRFGPPEDAVRLAILAVEDVERLRRMGDRVVDVSSWQQLLETP